MTKKANNHYRKNAKIKPSIDGILGLISFSTRIPINRYITLEKMSGSVILWPYIGLFIGIIGGIIAYILSNIFNFQPILYAALIYCFLIWFTGFNHIDGLLDMGDGLMAHGDHEKCLSIMRDSMVGTGGIATFFIVAVITIAVLASIPTIELVKSVILMEFCAKISMVTSMVFGKTDTKGIAKEIRKGMDYKVLVITIIIALIIGYLLLQQAGVMAVLASTVCGLYLSYVAENNFGCVTGDILGASNEISKAICLIFLILNLTIIAL